MNREAAAFVEAAARLTLATGVARGGGVEAVDCLGEDARTGGLAHTSWATEKVGVGELSALYGVFEGCG